MRNERTPLRKRISQHAASAAWLVMGAFGLGVVATPSQAAMPDVATGFTPDDAAKEKGSEPADQSFKIACSCCCAVTGVRG